MKIHVMKEINHVLVFIGIVGIGVALSFYTVESDTTLQYISLVFLLLFVVNLLARKSLKFKGYFTSPMNIFTAKSKTEKSFDISPELLFEKMLEIIEASPFKLADTDAENFQLLATTGFSFQSWGENLYFDIQPDGEGSTLNFCSASLFQMYTWGKNEKNAETIFRKLEQSFTI